MEERPQIELVTVFHRDTCHREVHQRNIRDKWLPREACFDLGDVKVEKDIVAFNADEDEDILVEDGPQIDRGTVFLWDTCHREIYQRNSRGKRLPREACLDLGDVKVVKEGGPQIERGMVFLRDTCHCFFFSQKH